MIIENGRNLIALPAVRFELIVYETSYLSSVKNISIQIKDGEILPIGNPREEIMTRRDSLSEQWRINLVDLKTATGRVKVVIPPIDRLDAGNSKYIRSSGWIHKQEKQ